MTENRYIPSPLAAVQRTGPSGATLVFSRDLRHPIDAVWEALTDPAQLAQWAPFTADRDLAATGRASLTMVDSGPDTAPDGGPALGMALPAEVITCEPPALLEYTWGDDVLRWELTTVPGGTNLTLRHTLSDPRMGPAVSAGWHICLDVADGLLAGQPFGPIVGAAAREHGWDDLNDAYAKELGLPPSQVW